MSRAFQSRRFPVSTVVLAVIFAITTTVISAQTPPTQAKTPIDPQSPAPGSTAKSPSSSQSKYERQLGRTTVIAPLGVRVTLGNRTTGRITVKGWDQEVIEARAVSERGEEVVIVAQHDDAGVKEVFLKADYANLENPNSPTQVLESPPTGDDGTIKIHLEVKVPRYAELEPIRVIRSNVEISGVDTPMTVLGKASSVTLKDVGTAEVHTGSGPVEIENAKGLAHVTSSSGAITISNSEGGVRATSIAGPIQIRCTKGRADVENVQAPIELEGVDGEVQAIAASGSVRFKGQLREDRRYSIKSLTGRVEMMLPANIRGFTATLVSYRGMIESDFLLKYNAPAKDQAKDGNTNVRLVGRFGNGSPQITLDSFEGLVKLTKVAPHSIVSCK